MSEVFERVCPSCGRVLEHKCELARNWAKKTGRLCRKCSWQERAKKFEPSFKGRRHTEETKAKIRAQDKSKWKTDEFKKKMSSVTAGDKNPMWGRRVYDVWVERYGKEEADKRHQRWCEKQRQFWVGKKNPNYGRTPSRECGNGWSGWYKDWFFRSLLELSYVIELDSNGIKWESAEKIRIPYVDRYGRERTYSPDFIVGDTVVEVKPRPLHVSPGVEDKRIAGERYCEQNGLTYLLIEPIKLPFPSLVKLHDSGEIKFLPRYKEKFQRYKDKENRIESNRSRG